MLIILFIDHCGNASSWCIVTQIPTSLSGDLKKLSYPICLLWIENDTDTFLTSTSKPQMVISSSYKLNPRSIPSLQRNQQRPPRDSSMKLKSGLGIKQSGKPLNQYVKDMDGNS